MEAHWILLALAFAGAVTTTAALVRVEAAVPPAWSALGAFTSELAIHQALGSIAVLALFAYFTAALAHEAGRLAALIIATSLVGLALIQSRVGLARRAIEAGLCEELGTDYQASIPAARHHVITRPAPSLRLLLPWPRLPRKVELTGDIPYPGGHVRNKLDVYRPAAGAADAPVLFYIHGEDWSRGHKRQQALPLLHRLAELGWVVVAPNYRLSPGARFPAQLIDCKSALAWVRAHIAGFGGDPNMVVVAGGSAGGQLAALVALTFDNAELQPGFEHVDTRPAACVSLYGFYDFVDRHSLRRDARARVAWLAAHVMPCPIDRDPAAWEVASPIAQLRADAPPFLVLHGTHDGVTSAREARAFAESLRGLSENPVVYAELPGAHHRWDVFNSPRALHTVAGITRFLEWCAAPQAVTGGSTNRTSS
jgi:acetyl esterase/lipase